MAEAARRWAETGLGIAAALSASATAAGAAGSLYWLFDLFSHFSLQLISAQLIILAGLILARRRRFALALLPFAIFNAAVVWPYVGPRSEAAAAGPGEPLTLITVNVAAHNYRFAGLRTVLLAEQPDFVIVTEYTPRWAIRFRELAARFPYRIEHAESGPGGIALFSRHPLTGTGVAELAGRKMIDTVARIGAGELRLVGVHLAAPTSPSGHGQRNRQLRQLAASLADSPPPTAVLGDFNLSVYSPVFRAFLADTDLSDALRGRGPDISWPTWFPFIGIPIDHCLVSDGISVVDYRRLMHFGSDHFPILTRIAL